MHPISISAGAISRFATLAISAAMAWPAAAAPVPLAKPAPVALESLRTENPAVVPMTGTWKFQITSGEDVADGHFVPSMDQYAKASSAQPAHPAADAFDKRVEAHWCAGNGAFPQWWQVDLGQTTPVRALELSFEKENFTYQFIVEGSTDGKAWSSLADLSAGAGNGPVKITPCACRYLRVTFHGAHGEGNAPKWAYIHKAAITILRDGKEAAWNPAASAGELQAADAFTRPNFDDAAWAALAVPANWEMAGFSKPTYNQPDNAAGLYRRWMEVPAGFKGKQIVWHFDGVFDSAEIFINGVRAGYHEGGFTAFDVDVTKEIKPGSKNLFAVRVCKKTSTVDLDTGDFWSLGGIYRENYLVALPQLHVGDIKITTPLQENHADATLKASVKVEGRAGEKFAVAGRLFNFDGTDAGMPEISQAGKIGEDGTGAVELQREIKAPKLWSAEKPNLYYLALNLSRGGKNVEAVQERFGFRQVEIRNGVVLWNGVPIKTAGTCRHEEWAALGHALNEAAWRKDIELIKAANINAVRTSHYNHAERFLELCDEKGLYILDEVPGCWCDPKAPELKPAWLAHTRETFHRDKNRACVLAWSIGNESGFGPSNLAALETMKQLDPTRPAFISQCGKQSNPALDFDDYHYPGTEQLKHFIASPARATTPFVITEGPHIFYVPGALAYDYGCKDFWGQALASQWKLLWSCPSALGAFIWEWQDQGIADKFPEKDGADPVAAALAGTQADTGTGAAAKAPAKPAPGSSPALRGNNNKGFVDGYRNVKPEYWQVKMVYSPVVIEAREAAVAGGQCVIPLRNRYSFTDLSELTCKWQALAEDKPLASGEAHLACPPMSTAEGKLPLTPGAEILAVQFVHPDGRTVYSARLRMPGIQPPAAPAPLAAAGPVQVEDQPAEVLIRAAGTELALDKQTGLIRSWQAQGENLVVSGPILNLGEARLYKGEHAWGIKNPPPCVQSKQAPLLKNVSVTCAAASGDQTATITVAGDVYLAEAAELQGQLLYTLRVQPDAQIDVTWKLTWKAADRDAFELGMKMETPAALNTLSWSREGQWTDYPAGYIGAATGHATSSDLSFRCTKRDIHWAMLSGSSAPLGLAALSADAPLHARALQGLSIKDWGGRTKDERSS